MFTDGVTEARSKTGEEFGDDRLVDCLVAGLPPADQLNRVFAAVRDCSSLTEQTDDITLTVTRYLTPSTRLTTDD